MPQPFEILALEPTADAQQIRQRYLHLVRENPPEKAPQRFAEIQAAYDKLRDPETRVEALLFDRDEDRTIDDLIRQVIHQRATQRWPTDALLAMGEE